MDTDASPEPVATPTAPTTAPSRAPRGALLALTLATAGGAALPAAIAGLPLVPAAVLPLTATAAVVALALLVRLGAPWVITGASLAAPVRRDRARAIAWTGAPVALVAGLVVALAVAIGLTLAVLVGAVLLVPLATAWVFWETRLISRACDPQPDPTTASSSTPAPTFASPDRATGADGETPPSLDTPTGREGAGRRWLSIALQAALAVSLFVAAVALQRPIGLGLYRVPTGSMWPTLFGDPTFGDVVLVDHTDPLRGDPARWGVYVVDHPGYEGKQVKRLVARPGETLAIRGGNLWIDGAIAVRPPAVQYQQLRRAPILQHAPGLERRVFLAARDRDSPRPDASADPEAEWVAQLADRIGSRFAVWTALPAGSGPAVDRGAADGLIDRVWLPSPPPWHALDPAAPHPAHPAWRTTQADPSWLEAALRPDASSEAVAANPNRWRLDTPLADRSVVLVPTRHPDSATPTAADRPWQLLRAPIDAAGRVVLAPGAWQTDRTRLVLRQPMIDPHLSGLRVPILTDDLAIQLRLAPWTPAGAAPAPAARSLTGPQMLTIGVHATGDDGSAVAFRFVLTFDGGLHPTLAGTATSWPGYRAPNGNRPDVVAIGPEPLTAGLGEQPFTLRVQTIDGLWDAWVNGSRLPGAPDRPVRALGEQPRDVVVWIECTAPLRLERMLINTVTHYFAHGSLANPRTLPADRYAFLGDTPIDSTDSRDWHASVRRDADGAEEEVRTLADPWPSATASLEVPTADAPPGLATLRIPRALDRRFEVRTSHGPDRLVDPAAAEADAWRDGRMAKAVAFDGADAGRVFRRPFVGPHPGGLPGPWLSRDDEEARAALEAAMREFDQAIFAARPRMSRVFLDAGTTPGTTRGRTTAGRGAPLLGPPAPADATVRGPVERYSLRFRGQMTDAEATAVEGLLSHRWWRALARELRARTKGLPRSSGMAPYPFLSRADVVGRVVGVVAPRTAARAVD